MTGATTPKEKDAERRVRAVFNQRRTELAEMTVQQKIAEEELLTKSAKGPMYTDHLASIVFPVDELFVDGLLDVERDKWERLIVTTAEGQFVMYPDGKGKVV